MRIPQNRKCYKKDITFIKKRLKPKSSFIKEQFMMDGERERERDRDREREREWER